MIRAHLILLSLTFVVCSVFYPLTVWLIGQGLSRSSASGSLVHDKDGKPVGSRLIAQEFKGDEWFHPRPSAVEWNASASSGSNLGSINPKLRDRAARLLGPVVKYRPGTQRNTVQKDIETWADAQADQLPDDEAPIAGKMFDRWLQANPDKAADIEPIPSDAVAASGSGLDPHITLSNAQTQLDRVVSAWAAKTKKLDPARVRESIEGVLKDASFKPLGGLVGGEALVNVLEGNVELSRLFAKRG